MDRRLDSEEALRRILDETADEEDDPGSVFSSEDESDQDTSDSEEEEGRPQPQSSSRMTAPRDRQWQRVFTGRNVPPFGGSAGTSRRILSSTSSAIDCFFQFFTAELIKFLVDMTNINAQKKIGETNARRGSHLQPLSFRPTTEDEMKAFLGLIILMGIIRLPRIELYWQQKSKLLDVQIFSKVMPRDRFRALWRYFHMCEEDAPSSRDSTDKLRKIRPFMSLLLPKFESVYKPDREIAIDESLIPFKGRIRFRQFIPSKRARFGIKVFVLAESKTGYVSRLQIYTGKDPSVPREVSLSSKVVNDLIRPFAHLNHHLYLDNYYTSPELFESLFQHGVFACGTIRPNRRGFPKDLILKSVSRVQRGFSDWRMSGDLLVQSWVDNRAVYFLSTIHRPEYDQNSESRSVKRRGGRGGQSGPIEIPCPPLLPDYNKYMGGVDLSDQIRKYYNLTRKSKIWYRRVFSYLLEIAIHNARVVAGGGQDGLHFRQELVVSLIGGTRVSREPPRRSSSFDIGRLQNIRHLAVPMSIQRVCAVCSKKNQMAPPKKKVRPSRSVVKCEECDVHLCVYRGKTCYRDYHTKKEYWW